MKSKIFFSLILIFVFNNLLSQTVKIVNPKGNWYFGVEYGINKIKSYYKDGDEPVRTLEVGAMTEYYFAKNFSVIGAVKYYETGLSFYQPDTHTGGWLDFGHDTNYGNFDGAVISFPLSIKWEFQINDYLRGNLKTFYSYNKELISNYGAYTPNYNTSEFSREYPSGGIGLGLTAFINKHIALYLDVEYLNNRTPRGNEIGMFGSDLYLLRNKLICFGVKFNFKKEKRINLSVERSK